MGNPEQLKKRVAFVLIDELGDVSLPSFGFYIAFKSNFATFDVKTGIVISRRAHRHFEEEGSIFCAALDGICCHSFLNMRYATEHQCGVVVKGPKFSGNISGTDPLKDNCPLLKAEALADIVEAKHTALGTL